MRVKDKKTFIQMGRDLYFMYRRQIKHSEILIKTEKSVGAINKSTIKVARVLIQIHFFFKGVIYLLLLGRGLIFKGSPSLPIL